MEFLEAADDRVDHAEGGGHRAALEVNVDAEAAHRGHRERKVQFLVFLEFLFLEVVQDAIDQAAALGGVQGRPVDVANGAVDAQDGGAPHRHVEVRSRILDARPQKGDHFIAPPVRKRDLGRSVCILHGQPITGVVGQIGFTRPGRRGGRWRHGAKNRCIQGHDELLNRRGCAGIMNGMAGPQSGAFRCILKRTAGAPEYGPSALNTFSPESRWGLSRKYGPGENPGQSRGKEAGGVITFATAREPPRGYSSPNWRQSKTRISQRRVQG